MMIRKIISLFTLLAFIVFSLSCYTKRLKEIKTAYDLTWEKRKIYEVITTSWKFIKFPKKTPGKIFNNKITGHIEEKVEISQIDIIDITKNVKGIYEIRTKDGRTYPEPGTIIDTYVSYKGKDNKIVISYLKSISIPLSEIKYIKVKRIDYRLTFLAVSLPIVLVILARALGRTMEFAY